MHARSAGRLNVPMSTSWFVRDQKPHRLIVISNTNEAKDDCVTVSEMEMLLSWILTGMTAQTHVMCHEGVSGSDFHMVFPVLTISFFMPTHARVVQAYFQNGQLNIQFTKFYNFDEPESKYIETMNDFLKWADSIPCGSTLAVHGDAKLAEDFHVVFDEKRQRASKPTQA
ncbi:uncharacterized protein ASPGLDRAFT_59770 [Aspergillus glaucus CBS 516.65]|uniref:Uncharacterized protein n=1 Tax=Aspergillus glaucus CBS 516.65 TaxID=1160497 RepID=A0A1L9VEA8_ASPGL|nr:hypothetical protein ASPGLDRAFT_59770 [Aspergillus glaucus CBS 516.65]OJJ82267.1 hypothetical protein ASPGLDRAFT_59770 [Aspergillus glaucus CBS 516.65]